MTNARSLSAAILLSALAVPAVAAEAAGPLGLTSLEPAFAEALALIVLACFFVPLSRRLGLGRVIG